MSALWSTIGRTSTETPGNFSGGQVRAISSAASRSGTSTTVKPPTTSLASLNGPSTTTALPPSPDLTVVAVVTGCSSAPPSAILPSAWNFSNQPKTSWYVALASSSDT